METEYNQLETSKLASLEKENIKMLILYRSLYLLKNKFQKYKERINNIYAEYKKSYKTANPIPLSSFKEIYTKLMIQCNFLTIPYQNYMELLTPDLLKQINNRKASQLTDALERYIRLNLSKYNEVFYEKKTRDSKVKKDLAIKLNPVLKEVPIIKEIVQYTKRGVIVSSNENMIANNKELELLKPAYQIEEDDIDIINTNKYLYAEMLPIAIADFLQATDQSALIDTNEEFNVEVKALFDNEILQQLTEIASKDPKEMRNTKIKNLLFEQKKVEKMLKSYQEILIEKSSKGENTIYIEKMLSKLREQHKIMEQSIMKITNEGIDNRNISNISMNHQMITSSGVNQFTRSNHNTIGNEVETNQSHFIPNQSSKGNVSMLNRSYLNVSKVLPKSMMSKEERRKAALTEIFYFYSRQHLLVGHTPTFDSLKNNENHINQSEFAKFCIEFKILVKKIKLVELFKKTASDRRQLSFDNFFIMLQKLAQAVNEEKKNYLMERIKMFMIKLDEYNNSEKVKIEKEKKRIEKVLKEDGLGMKETKEDDDENDNENQEEGREQGDESGERIETQQIEEENEEAEQLNQTEEEPNAAKEDEKEEAEGENKGQEDASEEEATKEVPKQKAKVKKQSKNAIKSQLSNFFDNIDEVKDQIAKLRSDYQKLTTKSPQQLVEELFQYLEIDNEEAYRQKMNGFYRPFNNEKVPRHPNSPKKNVSPATTKEIREVLNRRKEERDQEKKMKDQIEKQNEYNKKQKELKKRNEVLQINAANRLKEKDYKKIIQNTVDYSKEKEVKYNWDQVSNADYDHFVIQKNDEKFKEVINENNIDSEDEDLLRHLNHKAPKLIVTSAASKGNKFTTKEYTNVEEYQNAQQKGLNQKKKLNAASTRQIQSRPIDQDKYTIKKDYEATYRKIEEDKDRHIAKAIQRYEKPRNKHIPNH